MNYTLLIAALVPAIVLCIYLFYKDRVEKEPLGLLAKLLIFGVISCFPAMLGETFIQGLLNGIFSNALYLNEAGDVVMSWTNYHLYQFLIAFIGVALIEEGCKWIFLVLGTKKNKNFDHLFDGVIYATFVSLGFAAFENIQYVFNGGISVAISRAIFSIPGHMFFGVMMGYYYSFWHLTDKAAAIESRLSKEGQIPFIKNPFDSTEQKILSIVIPTLFHGFYDFCLFVSSPFTTVLFYIFVIFMYIYCFGKIKKMSQKDGASKDYAMVALVKKYPILLAKKESESDNTTGTPTN